MDAGIKDELFDSSSSLKTNSFEDGESSNNGFNENGDEQIGAGDQTKEEVKGNGEDIDQGGVKKGGETSVLHYAYRPSSPAHCRIKESPLSSDAIFKQVSLSFNFTYYFVYYLVANYAYSGNLSWNRRANGLQFTLARSTPDAIVFHSLILLFFNVESCAIEEALRSKSKIPFDTQTLSQSNRPTHKNQRDLPQFLRPTSLLNKSLHKPYKVALHFCFKFAHLLIITNP
ncbi:hypothetical protein L1887_37797 [Cichorium endivia]|nr:hypothetical protein L1887_37797 [Cichorium endivia]